MEQWEAEVRAELQGKSPAELEAPPAELESPPAESPLVPEQVGPRTIVPIHLRGFVARDGRRHEQQEAFVKSKAKRIIIRAGRRGGKTDGVAIKCLDAFLAGRRVLYTAPTGEQTDAFWYEVILALGPAIEAGAYVLNKTERYIEVPGTKNRIKAKTAWDADSLRGDWADLLVFDEWQLTNEDAWEIVGAPMLVDTNGDAVFVYTPPSLRSAGISKAHDPRHAAKMFKQAQADSTGLWAAFHFTSFDNPFISREGLTAVARDMSQASYRQEILAEDDELAASHLVYGAWNEKRKCRRFEIPLSWPVYSGHDFGSANPAALFLARAKLPLPPGAPDGMRYGDIVSWREYLPGKGLSTQLNVDAFKAISKGYAVTSAGGNHNEDGSRGDYTRAGWPILEPPIGAEGGPSLRQQVDRVVAIMEADKYWVFEDNLFELAELASCAWKYDREGNRTNDIDGEARYHLSSARRYVLALADFTPETVGIREAQPVSNVTGEVIGWAEPASNV